MNGILMGALPLAIAGPLLAQDTQPIYLSAQQFVDVKFPQSRQGMMPIVRNQLRLTNPNAKTDLGLINWRNAQLSIRVAGAPSFTFRDIRFNEIGTRNPSINSIAAEAYFNCTSQPETRQIESSDVRTTEAEQTRTRARQQTDRVKSFFTLTYEPVSFEGYGVAVSGGLGGSAGREFETTVVKSDEYITRTKETVQTTRSIGSSVTVLPLSLRFHEYVSRSETVNYQILGKATADVPIEGIVTRPAYKKDGWIRVPKAFGGWIRVRAKIPVAAKTYEFPLGKWSYYYPSEARTITQAATLGVSREMIVVGPVEVKFPSVGACYDARNALLRNTTDVQSLIRAMEQYDRQAVPL
ncbi:hypothetical protein Q9Q95_00935 [Sphingomonas sp. DG1-23]|uniref:hypothetical protein n=1 Tax=Sphingomonas sp. DG1-23 TaxID=3068316 RepID=UPI00273D15B4|nr:hypothetical protein [Sphingomonas sp. DG1-23]MDP5277474.1 hypothetical protein [Sphingomonas sp. DG1-23]